MTHKTRWHALRSVGALALAAWAAAFAGPARGADARAAPQYRDEYEVKAAFLYKFSLFVTWPAPSQRAPMVLGVVGDDPFGSRLETVLTNRLVNGQPFRVQRYREVREAVASHCRMIFICSSEKARLGEITEAARQAGVLTVADTEGYAQAGVMINMVLRAGNVRFEVNRPAAEKAGLRVSSQLMDLSIKPEKPGSGGRSP
jgi:hypothetical protein